MPAAHHPSAQALANFLIGDCSPGEALLIARHLESCPRCAGRVRAMGAVAGAAEPVREGASSTVDAGVEAVVLEGASGLGEAVYLLRMAPGAALPVETLKLGDILVLEGRLVGAGEIFGAGDFLSLDEKPIASLSADSVLGCACLATAAAPDVAED